MPQTLQGRYVDRAKLSELLSRLFGNTASFQVRLLRALTDAHSYLTSQVRNDNYILKDLPRQLTTVCHFLILTNL